MTCSTCPRLTDTTEGHALRVCAHHATAVSLASWCPAHPVRQAEIYRGAMLALGEGV